MKKHLSAERSSTRGRKPSGGTPRFIRSISRRKLITGLACLALIVTGAARPARAHSGVEGVVLEWNQAALQAVRETRLGPPMVARALAILHTAMFDAWAPYDAVAVGTQFGGELRRPPEERDSPTKAKAMSFAAYRVLSDLFPSRVAVFNELMSRQGHDPANTSTDTTTPEGIGNVVSSAILSFRHGDGSNQLGDLNPGAYSDYTGYRPVNTPDKIIDPERWQPLRLPNGTVQTFLVPQWGLVTPFALVSGSELRPKAPAAFSSPTYRSQAEALVRISAKLGDREKAISEYWSDGPASATPPGHWILLAEFVSERDDHNLDKDVKLFFALSNGLMDASIACWDAKRFYDYVRPISAIRFLFRGQTILAWAGPFQGTKRIRGEDWQPYQVPSFVTPPFAEYVSGHSTFSAASAEILKLYTGSDFFGAMAVIPAGSSLIEPGAVPSEDVLLSWATFSEAAAEAGLSRRFGGIHFEDGDLRGQQLGREIGARVWAKAQSYFNGTAR
ncbi:MAG TPA: phosphoesterase [Blastocatellia bacterium]|nr:phosphoesterase [Blastocatellia bacterium]